jgi:transposase InsO family protein
MDGSYASSGHYSRRSGHIPEEYHLKI